MLFPEQHISKAKPKALMTGSVNSEETTLETCLKSSVRSSTLSTRSSSIAQPRKQHSTMPSNWLLQCSPVAHSMRANATTSIGNMGNDSRLQSAHMSMLQHKENNSPEVMVS